MGLLLLFYLQRGNLNEQTSSSSTRGEVGFVEGIVR